MVVEVEHLRYAGQPDMFAEMESLAQVHVQRLKSIAVKIVTRDDGQVAPDARGAVPERIDVRGCRV